MLGKQVVSFNCVDKALLALESKNERMVFHIMLAIQGAIDPVKLNHAVLYVMCRHPTMRSLLRNKWFGHHREIQEDPQGEIVTVRSVDESETQRGLGHVRSDATHEEHLLQWLNQPLDVRESLPLRVLLLKRESSDHLLVFTFHHHAADGIRCLNFMKEVIDSYNGETNADMSPVGDACNLHKRDEVLNLIKDSRSRTRHFHSQVLSNLFHRFVIAPMSPPARIFHDRTGPLSPEVWFLCEKIEPLELERLESRSRASGATLNDLLLASCFKAVEKWNTQHGRPCQKISIMVPVDIGRHGPRHIVSNQVSYISPATTPEDRADPSALLAKTSTARVSLLKNGSASSMVYFTYLLSFLPLPLLRAVGRLLLLTKVCVDSVLLTNLGSIWAPSAGRAVGKTRVGDATVYDVTIATPVITPFRMGIAVATYNAALSICLSYRTCLVSTEKARAFLALYIEEIHRYHTGQE
jgi:NRPS condensation-like uncharacterized protein